MPKPGLYVLLETAYEYRSPYQCIEALGQHIVSHRSLFGLGRFENRVLRGVEQQPKYLGLSRFGCDVIGFLFNTGEPIQVLLFDDHTFLLQRLTDSRARTKCSGMHPARDVFECLHTNLSSSGVWNHSVFAVRECLQQISLEHPPTAGAWHQ